MKSLLRWSPWIAGLLVAAVAMCDPWQALGQATKKTPAPAPKKAALPRPLGGPVTPKAAPVSKKTPTAKVVPEAAATPAQPSPETEILEKLPPEVQDPLMYAAPPQPEAPGPSGPYRVLAPGVMNVITPGRDPADCVTMHNVVELEKYDWAKGVPFRREVWALEFRFKTVRILDVDVPQPSGKLQRKPIWYLVYSVTNRGKVMQEVEQPKDGTYKLVFDDKVEQRTAQLDGTVQRESIEKPVLFVPEFLLESTSTGKRYPDRVIPVAVAAIRLREDPNREFYNSAGIIRELKPGETVWGIASWEDIDPRTEQFSIYVAGLTNAYRWDDRLGAYKEGDAPGTGRQLWRRTLKLNFWRPGNERDVDESQIRFGVPGEPEYEWTYCDARCREMPRPAVPAPPAEETAVAPEPVAPPPAPAGKAAKGKGK
jgi:hypothetical protein